MSYPFERFSGHHYIQWVTPTGAERQGFYRLVEWLCEHHSGEGWMTKQRLGYDYDLFTVRED